MPYQYLIALGSNMGDRAAYLERARVAINQRLGLVKKAATHHATAPVGNADQEFINSALIASSELAPHEVMQELLEIELELGRKRDVHWGNRTIDLDIILIKDDTGSPVEISTDDLKVPHPRAHERDFVTKPCAEIAPDWLLQNRPLKSY